ncbi:MAG: hypothetical protein JWL84_493 [Rhodospirillales bacterium]|jgi:short-subunit dehydrogenase|nr:hypothetical protein [Rhodospirillales bacterium]
MTDTKRQLTVVTGASTGIGFELAKCCAENAYDLVVAAVAILTVAGLSRTAERRL